MFAGSKLDMLGNPKRLNLLRIQFVFNADSVSINIGLPRPYPCSRYRTLGLPIAESTNHINPGRRKEEEMTHQNRRKTSARKEKESNTTVDPQSSLRRGLGKRLVVLTSGVAVLASIGFGALASAHLGEISPLLTVGLLAALFMATLLVLQHSERINLKFKAMAVAAAVVVAVIGVPAIGQAAGPGFDTPQDFWLETVKSEVLGHIINMDNTARTLVSPTSWQRTAVTVLPNQALRILPIQTPPTINWASQRPNWQQPPPPTSIWNPLSNLIHTNSWNRTQTTPLTETHLNLIPATVPIRTTGTPPTVSPNIFNSLNPSTTSLIPRPLPSVSVTTNLTPGTTNFLAANQAANLHRENITSQYNTFQRLYINPTSDRALMQSRHWSSGNLMAQTYRQPLSTYNPATALTPMHFTP